MPYRKFRRHLTASYLLPFFLAMLVLAGVLLWSIHTQVSITERVEHSDQVILRTKDAELEMRRIQLGVRAYMYSPDKRFLTEIGEGQHEFAKELTRIAALVADNPEQEQRVLAISDLRETWTKTLENLLTQRDSGHLGPEEFAPTRTQTEALSAALEDLISAEYQLHGSRIAHQTWQNQWLFALVPLLSVGAMVFLSYWGWRQIRNASEEFRQALVTAEEAKVTAEEAKARSEEASQAKDRFLGTISHELRNPLNSIMLWSSTLLSDQTLSATTRRGLLTIERAVRAQAQLIEDLLDVSRIASGRLRLDVQSVDLVEVVQAAVEGMRAAAEAKSITLQEIADPRVGPIAGDPGRLQQVVWNLVSNAVKFTPRAGKIQVRVERINSHVEIIVADNGQGMEPTSLTSVFERFWQAEGKEQRQGVGLGLSIVKEIVSLHGGTVVAHSEGLGKGSTFTVRLPLPVSTTASAELRRHPTMASIANPASAPRLDRVSILVVDDDPDACDALRNLLGALGARVTAVTSAQAALELLDALQPDAVISDIGMPVQDGYFLANQLRRREQESGKEGRLPLVALTAYGRVEDKVQIFAAGFDNHVVKPVDPAELSAILGTLVASRRA